MMDISTSLFILLLVFTFTSPVHNSVSALVYEFPALRPPFLTSDTGPDLVVDSVEDSTTPYLMFKEDSFATNYLRQFDELTVECWIWLQQWDYDGAVVSKPFAQIHLDKAKHYSREPVSMFKLSQAGDSGRIRFTATLQIEFANDVVTQSQISVQSHTSIPKRTWTHIAGTWSKASNELRIFVNGQLAGLHEPMLPGTVVGMGEVPLFVGRASKFIKGQAFSGLLDELKIWSKSKSDYEMYNEYKSLLFGDEQGLLFYLNLENGATAEATGNVHSYRNEVEFNGATVKKKENAPVELNLDTIISQERSEL